MAVNESDRQEDMGLNPLDHSAVPVEIMSLYSCGFPAREMYSGALCAILVHLLALSLILAWPKIFPKDEFQSQVFMVSIIDLEAGASRLGADRGQGGAAEGAKHSGLDDAQSPVAVSVNVMEDPASAPSDPPDEGRSPPITAASDEPEEAALPLGPEPPAREMLVPVAPPAKSEERPQTITTPKKATKRPPQTRKPPGKSVETARLKDGTAPLSAHSHESASPVAPSSLAQGIEPVDRGMGLGGGGSAEPGRGEATGAKDARKGGGLGLGQQEFHVTQVDKPPEIVNRVEPDYPRAARLRKLSGRVVVKLLVDPRGRVQRKSIVEATPEGIFDGCVLDAVAQWRFKPGYYKGQPVSTWVVTPIQFKLSGR